jgi:hypothetical protein
MPFWLVLVRRLTDVTCLAGSEALSLGTVNSPHAIKAACEAGENRCIEWETKVELLGDFGYELWSVRLAWLPFR